jgi:acetylornithine deacetylase/succinyl-diaminopimelate desuccinylase-like protein
MTAELLQELIRIPSVNPDGDPGTDRVGERECAEFLAGFLRGIGAEVSLDEVLPGRPNVVAQFPADRPGKPRLLLAPHTDTVSVAGMTIRPFDGEIRDGRVWGRGACDTKGPMAAILVALKNCRSLLPALSHEIWFAGLVGEEAGQHGAKALAAREKFDLVIVGEPTGLEVVHTHKGAVWLTLQTTGRASHASMPGRGDNAIDKMLDVLAFLRPALRDHVAAHSHDVLGKPTFNIGTIVGGSKVNIVPDRCRVMIDMRTVPGQDVQPLVGALTARFPFLECAVRNSAAMYTDPAHPLIGKLAACGAPPVGAPWFCDGAIFAEAGSPAVALGPGSIAQAHTADEWISVADLEAGAAFFEKFLRSLA